MVCLARSSLFFISTIAAFFSLITNVLPREPSAASALERPNTFPPIPAAPEARVLLMSTASVFVSVAFEVSARVN